MCFVAMLTPTKYATLDTLVQRTDLEMLKTASVKERLAFPLHAVDGHEHSSENHR